MIHSFTQRGEVRLLQGPYYCKDKQQTLLQIHNIYILEYSNILMKELYNLHAEICKVFSNPIRLEILNLLRNKKMSVTELMKKSELSQANISQHLSIMKSKGMVSSERNGKNIYYRLTNPKITKAFDIIREVLNERLEKGRKIMQEVKI